MKFLPKTLNPNPTSLSTSLRNQHDAPPLSPPSGSTSSGVRMGDNGDWVPNREIPTTHDGNFVNYLPQDEAIAIGLGAEDGGLDPVESQRVADLLNRELSRLLKLSPGEFWKQGIFNCYKVAGAIAVENSNEASLVNQAQQELIHGLGRGGNLPLGAVKKLMEQEKQKNNQLDCSEMGGREHGRNQGAEVKEVVKEDKESPMCKISSLKTLKWKRKECGHHRGGGRRGGGGGRHNNYRKDRAMNKHFSGLTGS